VTCNLRDGHAHDIFVKIPVELVGSFLHALHDDVVTISLSAASGACFAVLP